MTLGKDGRRQSEPSNREHWGGTRNGPSFLCIFPCDCHDHSLEIILVAEEGKVKSAVLKPFLLGVTCGIGMTLLSLYAQKPGILGSSLETIAAKGRARRAKEEKRKRDREWLKTVGFSDDEIDGIY